MCRDCLHEDECNTDSESLWDFGFVLFLLTGVVLSMLYALLKSRLYP